ncbi:MAG: curli-like amyloid fiber formation chaperone CsgH [Burkholderiaceae bacterium]
MNADADIQVWLETMNRSQAAVVVPYVQSTRDRTLVYAIRAIKDGPGGHSVLSQGGTLRITANVPTALGRMTFSRHAGDDCNIDLKLNEDGKEARSYRYACPE